MFRLRFAATRSAGRASRCEPPTRSTPPESLWRDGAWALLTILGHYQKSGAVTEIGYRARWHSGAEITLVREPLGRWYADDIP